MLVFYIAMSDIQPHSTGANILLGYFHYCNKGRTIHFLEALEHELC